LVVEDYAPSREALEQLLSREGYEVQTARNGVEALDLLRRGERPAVILLDMMMAGGDGWYFLGEQKRDAGRAGIPVVIMAEPGGGEGWVKALGAAGRVLKPLDLGQVLKAVCATG
jgi:CheY-like chemotaxis protein